MTADARYPLPEPHPSEETTLTRLKPSMKSLIPPAATYLGLGVIATWSLLHFQHDIDTAIAQIGGVLGSPHSTVVWLPRSLMAIWALCLVVPLWRWLQLVTTSYDITTQRILYTKGILHRRRDQLEIHRIRDSQASLPLYQRLLGLGTLVLDTVDRSHPTFTIPYQPDIYRAKDWLYQLNMRERARLGYREIEGTQGIH